MIFDVIAYIMFLQSHHSTFIKYYHFALINIALRKLRAYMYVQCMP